MHASVKFKSSGTVSIEVLIVQFLSKSLGFYGIHENYYADRANSCNELDALTGKRIKFVT